MKTDKKQKRRKVRRKVFSLFLAVVLIAAGIDLPSFTTTVMAATTDTTGKIGTDVSWSYDDTKKTLTISGTGNMYGSANGAFAGYEWQQDVKMVVIQNGVTDIGTYVFAGMNITYVEIPNSITKIGFGAFENCTSLTEVTIPASVQTIEESAFSGCTSLDAITLPSSLTSIPANLCSGCTALQSVEIPANVKSIQSSAFENCTSLTEVTIPASVTSIYNSAFSGCTALQSVEIPNGVESISQFAFENCTSLREVTIPASVQTIGGYAFYECTSLTEIELPNNLTSIAEFLFMGCESLANVKIPASVTSIGNCAFENCSSLKRVEIPEKVSKIGAEAFWGCTSLESVNIPASVTSIEVGVFRDCTSLTEVEIPGNVSEIMSDAFRGCTSLTEVTIPEKVTSIGDRAFQDCTALSAVFVKGDESAGPAEIGTDVFSGSKFVEDNTESITVPETAVAYYLRDWTVWAPYIKNKNAGAKQIIDWFLKEYEATNGTTKEVIQSAVENRLSKVGIKNATVTVDDFQKQDRNISGTVNATIPDEEDNADIKVTFEMEIKLTDAEKVAAVKEAVEKVLDDYTATNDTTKDEIESAIEEALKNVYGIDGTSVAVQITKKDALSNTAGSVKGTVTIKSGSETGTVVIDKEIARLIPLEGMGTVKDPYQIDSQEALEKLRDLVNGGEDFEDVYFEVTKDIDLGGSGEDQNPWTPIGTEDHPFNGTLDGDGHTVSGLYVDDRTKDNQGLFGVNAGTIEDLTVEGSVTGKDNVGGIAGKNDGTIVDCTNNGTVTGTGNNVGGITGNNTETVSGDNNTGAVNGNDDVGGITGTNTGKVEDSTNRGTVTGNDNVGGITGTNGENGTVEGCTNSGNVTVSGDGESTLGAIIGNNENTDPDAVKDDYYQKTDTVNKDLTGIGEGTGAEKDPEGITTGQTPMNPNKPFNGYGTAEDPYKISSKEDLENLRDLVNSMKDFEGNYLEVTKDIDLGGNEENPNPWTPIGTEDHLFKGTLDGDGHTVSGLYVNDGTEDNQGLFGVNAGTIENLTVEGSVTGKDNVGGIAGTNTEEGTIKDCTSNVTVTGENNVGGIAGKNDGTIEGCTNNGIVTGKDDVGGITGTNRENGTVEDSTNSGSVTGTGTGAGGITGTNNGSLDNDTNTAPVTGKDDVGGITGTNGENGTVEGCTNSGNVTVSGDGESTPGAIIGNNENEDPDAVKDDYYQKTDSINQDLTGIGEGTGAGTDPAGITSGQTSVNLENLFNGSGTVEDPYEISSKDDLEKLRDLVNGEEDLTGVHFQITEDIDLGGSGEDQNLWTPIGTEEHPFNGTLDGDGHTVSGLYVHDGTENNQGLFGVNAGTIENLTVEGSVTGKDNVGGIAGTNTADGTIKGCTSNVTVTGENNVGGIAGKNDGIIEDCTNTGAVSGNDNVGGIAGTNGEDGTVEDSTNSGSVTGTGTGAGGITGTNNGSLDNDTNTAPVTGKDDVGGITGTNGENGTVEGCTNSGNVKVSGDGESKPGAIIGNNENEDPDAVKDDYYQKTDSINQDLTGIGEGTGAGTDPAGITSGQTSVNLENLFNGSGTVEDPYEISSKDDLENLRDLVNGGADLTGVHFQITEDIDLGGSGENLWTPIGTEDHPFNGTLDGDGHTVSGLYVDDGMENNQGFFGVNAGTIENLTVEGSVTGKDNVGGIAGTNTADGTIKGCTSNVTVTGENNVGGIAGKNDGTIVDCTNNGTVTGTGSNVGGVTGNNAGTVNGSDNTGAVSGNDNVGGITGNNTGTVSGSDNTGAVSGNDNVGGITGNNTGTVSGSDNTEAVSGNDNVGGITGNNTGKVEDSTNRGTVTGTGTGAGGIAGTNNGSLEDDTNTAPVTGKDDVGGITGTNGWNGTVEGCTNSGNVTVSGDGDSTPGAIIGNNQNIDPDAVKDDYYQKTDTVNKDLTGIGEGTGAGTDPAGIMSGQTPMNPEKPFNGSGTAEPLSEPESVREESPEQTTARWTTI